MCVHTNNMPTKKCKITWIVRCNAAGSISDRVCLQFALRVIRNFTRSETQVKYFFLWILLVPFAGEVRMKPVGNIDSRFIFSYAMHIRIPGVPASSTETSWSPLLFQHFVHIQYFIAMHPIAEHCLRHVLQHRMGLINNAAWSWAAWFNLRLRSYQKLNKR